MRRDLALLCAVLGAMPGGMPGGPVLGDPAFAPVPAPEHVYDGGWLHFVGGGLAGFDCDGDDLADLFAAGGENPAQLLRNRSTRGGPIVFQADAGAVPDLRGVTGAYPLDINGDGWMDLAVLRAGANTLLRGAPDCRFTPFDDIGFASAARWTTAFSALWEQGHTLPTLAFGNYVDRSDPKGPFRACDAHWLYRPDGTRYGPPQRLEPGFCALSMLFSDWNRNGQPDLRLSNDRHYYVDDGQEQMWRMTDPPRLYGVQDGWRPYRLWGMGIASRDLDHDGLPEVFLSSMGDQRLQERDLSQSGPVYRDVPYARGTTAQRPHSGADGRPSTGWHIVFGDVDNDGRDDAFIAKGNVDQMPDSAMQDPNSLLMQRADGSFAEQGGSSGVGSPARGRGAVMLDFNLDGLLDLAVLNRRAPLELYRNVTPQTGHWLSVRLTRGPPNVNAVGSWIELDDGQRVHAREVTVGGGHAGGAAGAEHFGLGHADSVTLRVVWPDGVASGWSKVRAGQMLEVTRDGADLMIRAY